MLPASEVLMSRLAVSSSPSLPGEYPVPSASPGLAVSPDNPLTQAVRARKAEYTYTGSIKIKVGTWNVASFKGTDTDIGKWFISHQGVTGNHVVLPHPTREDMAKSTQEENQHYSSDEPPGNQEARSQEGSPTAPSVDLGRERPGCNIGIYALGLQEVVDVNSAVEAFRPYSAASIPNKFKTAMKNSVPAGYQLVAEQQLIGLLLLIYAAPDVVPHIHSVSTTSSGTGLMGYMGNKGAVAARLVLGETTRLVFINSHLSSGRGKTELERRNWDYATITNRVRFDPIADTFGTAADRGEKIGNEDFAFWFGDLNYRLEGIPGDDVRRILTLHAQSQHNNTFATQSSSSKTALHSDSGPSSSSSATLQGSSETSPKADSSAFKEDPDSNFLDSNKDAHELDPFSLQATLSSLLPHDELRQQQSSNKAFHQGWREGPINFLPTYKYDVGSIASFDSGEKKRGPSWCDRILYRTRKDLESYEQRVKLEQEAKDRDNEMAAKGITRAAEAENTMFEYDPEADGDDDYEDRSVHSDTPSVNGFETHDDDTIRLEAYTSHQKIMSSDHKPLDAVFTLTYDAVDSDLKSKIQSHIARDIDRAENEGRPIITVIVEGGSQEDDASFDGINFGDVRYDDPKTCFVTIANTGSVTAHFGFMDQPQQADGTTPLPSWLSVNCKLPSEKPEPTSPQQNSKPRLTQDLWCHGISKVFDLEPGESTTVDLRCHVKDQRLVKSLNVGDQLDNVLILRVKDGRDHFLPVKGSWRSSVQGRTIDRLIRIPEGGVRALQGEEASQSSGLIQSGNQAVMWSAPREIFRLTESIESLTERITAEWNMLGQGAGEATQPPMITYAGWPFVEESWTLDKATRQQLRVDVNEALDTDRSFDSTLSSKLSSLHRLEVFADALLDFLANLEDGVVPASLWERLKEGFFAKEKLKSKKSVEDKRAAILEILASSQGHNISFVLLTSMLARISQDIVSAIEGYEHGSQSIPDIAESPKVKVKRKSLSQNPREAMKELIQKNFAAVFADILVRTSDEADKGKGRSPDEGYRRELIEIFLESNG